METVGEWTYEKSTCDDIVDDLTVYLLRPDEMIETLDEALLRLSEEASNFVKIEPDEIEFIVDTFSDKKFRKMFLEGEF